MDFSKAATEAKIKRIILKKSSSFLTANQEAFLALKSVTSRYFQFKIGYTITATYLKRIKKTEYTNCWWCSNRKQIIKYLLFKCTH